MLTNEVKIVFLFSGQGSQYRGMGQRLYENNDVFRSNLQESDALIHRQLNRSLIDEIYHKPTTPFDELLITHPAIVAIELAMLKVMEDAGIAAHYFAGNSLGEFAAAVAAGIWDAGTALEAALEQAKAITEINTQGGMLSVINQKIENWEATFRSHQLYLASENFPAHFTLSGKEADLNNFEYELERQNAIYQRLSIAHPFHSPLIESGASRFNYYLNHLDLPLWVKETFVSGIKGKVLSALPGDYFWQVARQPSNFIQLTAFLEEQAPCLYIDLGPSGTCANFIKHNLDRTSKSRYISILTPFRKGLEQLEKLKQILS